MREILFRGKRVDNGEWIYGDLHLFEGCFIGITYVTEHIDEGRLSNHKWIEVIPETVCQFTGLTDKNGTKIFEGDVLIYHTTVKNYEDDDYNPRNYNMPKYSSLEWKDVVKYKGVRFCIDFDCTWSEAKILGNIHDNPELC